MSGKNPGSDSLEDVEMGQGSGDLLHPQSTTPTATAAATTTPRRVHYSDHPADSADAFASHDETAPPYSNPASRSMDGEVQKTSFSQSRDNFGSASIDTPQQRSSGEDDDDDSLTDNIDGKPSGLHHSSGDSNALTHTNSTGSGASVLNKSGLPCGMSMTTVMVLLIALPIAFLVTYTAIPLNEAVAAQNYINHHRTLITQILDLAGRLQSERRYSALILGSLPNSTVAAANKGILTGLRPFIEQDFQNLFDATTGSDMADVETFSTQVHDLLTDVSHMQQRCDDRTIDGPSAREEYLKIIERVYALMMVVANDPRASELQKRMLVFMLMRRLQNSLSFMSVVAIALMTRDGYDTINLRDLEGMKLSVDRDIITISASGDPEAVAALTAWQQSADTANYNAQLANVISGNPASWAAMSQNSWNLASDAVIVDMNQEDSEVLDSIVAQLQASALTEGMQMFGAVMACVIAAGLVIWLNYREQKRMETALKATRALAQAVQRFVPRNQLKTMGVRSITQVTSGLQVEVAQTMLFSDIRDFTGLSEQMKNVELFEWLQNYVSRMTKVTVEEKGYVDKFIGDALFCVFPQPTNGLKAAIQMHVSTDQLNLELVAQKHTKMVAIGVGLHYGVVIAGVFGDSTRLSCTMVASDVNLASRLEALTKSFGAKIIASEAVISQVDKSAYDLRPLGKVQVAGSSQAVSIYDIFQNDTLALKTYKHNTLAEFEKAILLADRDPSAASPLFVQLVAKARSLGLSDVAAEKKVMAANISPHQTVLAFEKDGHVRSGSPSLLNIDASHTHNNSSVNNIMAGLGSLNSPMHHGEKLLNTNTSNQGGNNNNNNGGGATNNGASKKVSDIDSTLPHQAM